MLFKCLYCDLFADPAEIAIHYIDAHEWEYDRACAWLREKIEEAA
jgi:hypothetical protein